MAEESCHKCLGSKTVNEVQCGQTYYNQSWENKTIHLSLRGTGYVQFYVLMRKEFTGFVNTCNSNWAIREI